MVAFPPPPQNPLYGSEGAWKYPLPECLRFVWNDSSLYGAPGPSCYTHTHAHTHEERVVTSTW